MLSLLNSSQRKTGESLNNVLRLLSGSAVVNLILFMSAPFIARVYFPADVGIFQQIVSLSAVMGTLCTLSYHYAIQLPKEESYAIDVAGLSILLIICFAILLDILLALIPWPVWQYLRVPITKLEASLLIPTVVLVTGFQLVVEQIALRKKEFTLLASTRVTRIGIAQGGALLLGLILRDYLGMLLAYILGIVIGISVIYLRLPEFIRITSISTRNLKRSLKKYWKMPAFDTPSMFVNSVSNELPVLMFGAFFSSQKVGFYAIALRLGKAPLSMLGTAVSEVFFQKAASQYYINISTVPSILTSAIKRVAPISAVITGGLYIVSPPLVYYYLGPTWADVASLIRRLLIWFFFESIYNPVSTTFLVLNRQEVLFTLNLSLLIARAATIYYFRNDFEEAILALSLVSAAMYVVYIFSAYQVARKGN